MVTRTAWVPAPASVPAVGARGSSPSRLGRTARAVSMAALGAVIVALGALVLVEQGLGWEPLTEQSGSMAPLLEPGQVLFGKPVAAASVHPGEVITFQYTVRHEMLTHRVLSVRTVGPGQLEFVTKGDAVPSHPGTETWRIPARGTVKRLVGSPLPSWVGGPLQALRGDPRVLVAVMLAAALAVLALGLQAIWSRPEERA